jgi:peptidoglycan/LPS O-acetylase OafA/YrhL
MEIAAEVCQRNWWHNLLYINNLIDYGLTDAACHGETWYLANDMQFFIVSPLLIYPLWRWRKIGLGFLTLASAASIAVPFIIHYNLELNPTLLPFDLDAMDYMYKSYQKPWMRIGPYLVGLWAGYLLFSFSNKRTRLQLPRWAVMAGWCISTGTAFAIIFGIKPWFDMGAEIPNLDAAFYAGFHRFAWGVVISWVIIACTQGYGGFVNTFLSWKVFMPLGRLTFCVYLISFQLQGLFHNRVRQAVSYDAYTATHLFFAHMVMSCLVGFVCCITMESPFIVLEKIFFGGSKPSKEEKAQPQSDVKVINHNDV